MLVKCNRCGCDIPAERSAAMETSICVNCSRDVGGETVLTFTTDESGVVTEVNHTRRVMPPSPLLLHLFRDYVGGVDVDIVNGVTPGHMGEA